MSSPHDRIWVKAFCLFFHEGRTLLIEVAREDGSRWYRPVGGTVELREKSADAAAREVKEELGLEVDDLRLLEVYENVFPMGGGLIHEIDFIYAARFVDPECCRRPRLEGTDSDGSRFAASWTRIAGLPPDPDRFYPRAILDLIRADVA